MRRNQTSQERFRENYDAAFGRDVGAGRDVTAERGVGVGAERGTRPSNASSTPGASSGSSFARSDAPSNNPSAERPRNAAFDPQKGSGT